MIRVKKDVYLLVRPRLRREKTNLTELFPENVSVPLNYTRYIPVIKDCCIHSYYSVHVHLEEIHVTTLLSTSLGKTFFFSWCFILSENTLF